MRFLPQRWPRSWRSSRTRGLRLRVAERLAGLGLLDPTVKTGQLETPRSRATSPTVRPPRTSGTALCWAKFPTVGNLAHPGSSEICGETPSRRRARRNGELETDAQSTNRNFHRWLHDTNPGPGARIPLSEESFPQWETCSAVLIEGIHEVSALSLP